MKAGGNFAARVAALAVPGGAVLAWHGVEVYRGGRDDALIACPFHDDVRPSFSVHLATGRRHCFACGARVGDAVALHKALGGLASMGAALLELEARRGVPPPPLRIRPAAHPGAGRKGAAEGQRCEVRRWTYRRADGGPEFDVVRLQFKLPDGSWELDPTKRKPRKEYRPAAPGCMRWGMPPGFDAPASRPLFGLPELLALPEDTEVLVVEGEPPAESLRSNLVFATTSSGGAAAAEKTDWSPLAGRRVVVWPDNDEAGRGFAERVTELLRAQAPGASVTWVDVARLELPPGGDAVDWLARRNGGVS